MIVILKPFRAIETAGERTRTLRSRLLHTTFNAVSITMCSKRTDPPHPSPSPAAAYTFKLQCVRNRNTC
jgi:hypothetical protein